MNAASLFLQPSGSCLGGMLAIWHDVAAGEEAAVRAWYAREHHFERLAIPGFVDARRFERVSGLGADVFGAYGVQAPEVLRSDAYLARVNAPTEGTREAMRGFRNMSRTVCRVASRLGRAQGGHVAVLASNGAATGDHPDLGERLFGLPGVLQVTTLLADPGAAPAHTVEQTLRAGPDTHITWALLVDADSLETAEQALRAAQHAAACAQPAQAAVYRLCFSARNP